MGTVRVFNRNDALEYDVEIPGSVLYRCRNPAATYECAFIGADGKEHYINIALTVDLSLEKDVCYDVNVVKETGECFYDMCFIPSHLTDAGQKEELSRYVETKVREYVSDTDARALAIFLLNPKGGKRV